MPNGALTAAIIEAYATAPADVVYLETLEIFHPDAGASIYLVKDRVDHNLDLADGSGVKTFEGCGFRFTLPSSGVNGVQELSISVDNVDRRVSDFIDTVKESDQPVTITYRPYLASDPSTPCLNPPLVLYLRDVVITALEVSGKATFADILNKKFLTEIYTRENFPSLAN